MAKTTFTNRTTLWDDDGPADAAVTPQLSGARGAWRAPSAVLSERRVTAGAPSIRLGSDRVSDLDLEPDEDDAQPIPRRSKTNAVRSYASRSPWWRPRSGLGRALLGTAFFVLLAGLAVLAFYIRQFLVRDAHFRIPGAASIASTGLSEVNRADVLPVFGEDIGRNIFFVPLEERRKELEAIPWVRQATVMRLLPDHLSVSIVERTPVAFVRQGDTVKLADADGVILSMPPAMLAQHHYSFPVVTGIDPKDAPAARKMRMAVYQRFVGELDQNGQHLSEQVSEIDLSDPEDLRATMPEQGADILAHFGEGRFLERLQIYRAHIAEWRQRYPRLIGVDLRYNGEVPLEMATDSGASGVIGVSGDGAASAPDDPKAKPAPLEKPTTAAAEQKKPETKPKAKAPPSSAAARKAAETKKETAKKKAAKLKAAKAKTAGHKNANAQAAHTAPQLKQGQ